MAKNILYNIFYVAEYVAFILATIAVIVFQFTAAEFLVVCALILYVVAFGIMTTNECIGVDALKKKLAEKEFVTTDNKQSIDNNELASNGERDATVSELQPEGNASNLNTSLNNATFASTQKEMAEIKKQINWGYAKIVLCAVFCVFSFVVLVLF